MDSKIQTFNQKQVFWNKLETIWTPVTTETCVKVHKNNASKNASCYHSLMKIYVFFIIMCEWRLFSCFSLFTQITIYMEAISLWHWWGGMEAQVALIAAFRSSALLGLVSLIFLLTIPHRFSMVRSGKFAGQSSTVTPRSLNQLLVPLAVRAGKWNQHRHKACQQKEAWSALKCPGRWLPWLWTSKNAVDQHQQMKAAQIITDCGNFTLNFKQHGFCSSPHFLQTLGPWFPN